MPGLPTDNPRVLRQSIPGDWAAALRTLESPRRLKDHPGGTVWRATLLGHDCILKSTPLIRRKRRAQALLHRSPAWKHWRAAHLLFARGIDTAPPLALLRYTENQAPFECLVLAFLPGGTVLEHLADRDLAPSEEHRLAEAVATLACTLASHGLRNRDAKPSNLVVTSIDRSAACLAVIDCADLRRVRGSPEHAVAQMLASAFIEPLGCGLTPRRALCARAVHTAAHILTPDQPATTARRLWQRAAAIVTAHGDATPADNPLRTQK
ncbi:MAG: hypothetical protein ACF8LK_04205 [Phycisphaerales bacterium JB041]